MKAYVAIDLGAESGRVMLGRLDGLRLKLEEIHRFANRPKQLGPHWHWDLEALLGEIAAGVQKAADRGVAIDSLSADSWGVDYVLRDATGRVLAPAYCYRNGWTAEATQRLFQRLPFTEIYRETGIQFMAINTLYHFEAQQNADPAVLGGADHFLNIADHVNAEFSGVPVAEESLASTTQIYNPRTHAWSEKLADLLGIKMALFPRLVPSATVLGPLAERFRHQPALAGTQVIATCSHDTGCAVAAVPASGNDWAYLSSGTWSLLGAELSKPIVSDAAEAAGFTNEVGLGGTIRFLKNIAGLWVLQECRRAWEASGTTFTYDQLTRLAEENGPAAAHISLDDARFLAPGDMPHKIEAFCRETGQPLPTKPGQFARTILESLALTYATTVRELESVTERKFSKLHIVGGGSRSSLLNQLAADATGLPVVAGPVEATAVGNILIQALALGQIDSIAHLREIVASSFPTQPFQPGALPFSPETRARFLTLPSTP